MMDWRYAAGLFDGEGSLGLAMDSRWKTNTCTPFVCLTQAEKYRGFRALTELAELCKSEGIRTYTYIVDQRGMITGGGKRNYRTMRFFVRSHPQVTHMLGKMLPYLIIRKNSAEDMLRFLILFPPRTGPNARGPLRGKSIGVREARQAKRATEALTPL